MKKIRLDQLLVKRNYYKSRNIAKNYILSGDVLINEVVIDKPGQLIDIDANIRIKEKMEFVSRGGYKLKKGIEEFNIDLKDKVCIDMGASTGGFSDCMLKNNAKKIYAVDVGYGQLDWSLRNNEKVVVIERTNIRYMDINLIDELINFISIDVSFISIKLLHDKIKELIINNKTKDLEIFMLIKPQFEVGKGKTDKGIVKDSNLHFEVIKDIVDFFYNKDFSIYNLSFSPIKGQKGNIEFILYLKYDEERTNKVTDDIIKLCISNSKTFL